MLSIAIPTFNRYNQLKSLVDSIIIKVIEEHCESVVQIVISDNGSTDGTSNYLKSIDEQYLFVTVNINKVNLGFGVNVNKAISICTKKYVWTLGSDETINIDSLTEFISTLDNVNSDVFVFQCHNNKGMHRRMLNSNGVQSFNIETKESFSKFVSCCLEFSAVFAFMSIIVFKRGVFCDKKMKSIIEHPYTHMLIIIDYILKNNSKVTFVPKSIVISGSEISEWRTSETSHLKLDMETAKYICSVLCENDSQVRTAYRKLFFTYTNLIILKYKSDTIEWNSLKPCFQYFKIKSPLYKKTHLDGIVYHSLRNIYKACKKVM